MLNTQACTQAFEHPGHWSHHAQLMVIKEGPMDVTWIVRQLQAALFRNWLVKRVPTLPERVLLLQLLLLLLSSLACQSYKVPGYNFCNAEQAKPQQQQDVPSMHTRWYCALPTSLLPTNQWVNLPAAFPTTPILFSNTSHPAFALSLSLSFISAENWPYVQVYDACMIGESWKIMLYKLSTSLHYSFG